MMNIYYKDRNKGQEAIYTSIVDKNSDVFRVGDSITFTFSPFIYKVVDVIFVGVDRVFGYYVNVYVKATEFKIEYIGEKEFEDKKC